MKIRDILLLVVGITWAFIMVYTVFKSNEPPPPDLWAILGGTIATILFLFRDEKGDD